MKAKHTPGPWIAAVDLHANRQPLGYDTDDVYAEDGSRVCRMTGNVARSYHDARLIAAAPEMLDALRELQGQFGDEVETACKVVDGPLSRSWRDYREAVARVLASIEGNETK
jgi:hypothetical protein